MYINNLDPVLVHLGPLQIRWYGLVFLFGALITYWALDHARKKGKLNLTKDNTSDLILWLLLGTIIGARIFEVLFFAPNFYFIQQPLWKIIAVWEGGLSFHGGLVGIVTAAYLFCKKKNINVAKIADILAIPLVLALALGRVANFINGELWGTITNAKWCVVFPNADNACRHPYQLYESLKRFIIFTYLLIINKKTFKPGFIFWNFVFFEGLGRFILDFWKEDALFLTLTPGQWLSAAMILISIIIFLKYYKEDCKTLYR